MSYSKVFLKPKKEESLLRFHPWVFSGAIQRIEGKPEEGDLVEVYGANQQFLAVGHYQIGSIAVRVLSFTQREIDHTFWVERIRSAYQLRCILGLANTPNNNTYRLVHGEGDSLPGLVIDMYAHTAVMQAHSVGMHKYRLEIAEALKEVLGDTLQNIYYKSETTLPYKADLNSENGYIYGHDVEDIALENGLKFCVDWQKGQKTGFFVDQRENRSLLEHYSKGRSVLNMFCYTGGFSFYAMRGGAKLVHSVDSSAKAISLTNRNVELNFPGDPRHQAFAEDAFKYLERMGNNYDLIILDPPAFAKHKNVLRNALQGYRGRYFVHVLLLSGCQQREFQTGCFQRCSPSRKKCPHLASIDTTGRSSGQYLSSGRRISERIGSICRIIRIHMFNSIYLKWKNK